MQTKATEIPAVSVGSDSVSLVCSLQAQWRFKVALSTVLPVLFWTGYLLAQRYPLGVVRPAPSLAVDAWIPFLPAAVYLYESLWLLQSVAPWLMRDRHELWIYCRGLLMILAVALSIFIVWPTASPRPECTESVNALYRALIQVDLDLNAFPSLHVSFALYSALGCRLVFAGLRFRPGLMVLIWVWTAGILVATVLTKQHTVLDVAAGALLGWVGYALYLRNIPMRESSVP
jgi:membrane-associated phospholipid phosphatase